MLSKSDTPISDAIASFAEFGVDAAYLSPTETAMTKSIMDAVESVRSFLVLHDIHDFEKQSQGKDNKVRLPLTVIGQHKCNVTTISLYRPDTKVGDPRLWVYGLKRFASANNLLALLAGHDGSLHLVNCSDRDLMESRHIEGSPLNALLRDLGTNPVAVELLELLREISRLGFVEAVGIGDKAVGMTVEALLGLPPNSSKNPDYKGIELKSARMRSKTRSNLFAKTPDWKSSAMKARQILDTFGYIDNETSRLQLYCTVAARPNPQGLFFDVPEDQASVENRAIRDGTTVDVARWRSSVLIDFLANKHRETFWIKADHNRRADGKEEFLYLSATHTRTPLVANFVPLISEGKITMDYTLSLEDGAMNDHGYLFKIHSRNLGLLFPEPVVHSLV